MAYEGLLHNDIDPVVIYDDDSDVEEGSMLSAVNERMLCKRARRLVTFVNMHYNQCLRPEKIVNRGTDHNKMKILHVKFL